MRAEQEKIRASKQYAEAAEKLAEIERLERQAEELRQLCRWLFATDAGQLARIDRMMDKLHHIGTDQGGRRGNPAE